MKWGIMYPICFEILLLYKSYLNLVKTTNKPFTIREKIQYNTAIIFLFTGIVMCFLSFFLNEYDINNGVLFYLGTAVTFCGAVFGLDVMIKNHVYEMESNIIKQINSDKNIE